MDGAVALRHIGSRSKLLGTDDARSLQNVNTTLLDDGCLCWVSEIEALYMLDKSLTPADVTPIGVSVVEPGAGPGLWFWVLSAFDAELSASMALINTPQSITSVVQSTWHNPPAVTNAYALSAFGPGFWTLDATTGLVTYSGPNGKRWEVTVNASIAPAAGTATSIEVVPALAALIGTTTDDFYAGRAITPASANAEVQLTSSKFIQLTPGDVLRPAIRNLTGTGDLSVERLSMLMRPAV